MDKHLHWEFMAGSDPHPTEIGHYFNMCLVTVIGFSSEEEALTEVKKMAPDRAVYKLNRTWECSLCIQQAEAAKAQIQYFKRMMKAQGIEKRPWEKDEDTV